MFLHIENNIAPNGAVLDHFLKSKLNYRETPISKDTPVEGPHIKVYQKTLSGPVSPQPHLNGHTVTSFIVVDLINSKIIQHYIQINHNSFHIWIRAQVTAKNFMCNCLPYDTQFIYEIDKLLTWQFNIIAAIKDYINGGWLKTQKIKDIVAFYDNKRELPYSNLNYKNVNELTKYSVDEIDKMTKKKAAIRKLKKAGILNKDGSIAEEYKNIIVPKQFESIGGIGGNTNE